MKRIPSLHALRAFEAAARLGSFTRAGEELNLTPSAISHQIRALEEDFKKPLFLRANRQVILTPEGERLLVALSEAFGMTAKTIWLFTVHRALQPNGSAPGCPTL